MKNRAFIGGNSGADVQKMGLPWDAVKLCAHIADTENTDPQGFGDTKRRGKTEAARLRIHYFNHRNLHLWRDHLNRFFRARWMSLSFPPVFTLSGWFCRFSRSSSGDHFRTSTGTMPQKKKIEEPPFWDSPLVIVIFA
jgi:hypothetical protein